MSGIEDADYKPTYRLNIFKQFESVPFVGENGKPFNFHLYERQEQLLAYKFVQPHYCVLEAGARLGVVSAIINSMLDDKTKHVAVEPDESVIDALNTNKRLSKSEFQVYQGIITAREGTPRLVQNGSASFIDYADEDEEAPIVKTTTLEALEQEVGFKFDCLIVDNEGGLQDLLDTVSDVGQFKLIMFEADRKTQCDYKKIQDLLIESGFLCLADGFHSVYLNLKHLPFAIGPEFSCTFGSLGLEGLRGTTYNYDVDGLEFETRDIAVPKHIADYAQQKKYPLHTICAHADSTFEFTPKVKCEAVGFIQSDVSPWLVHEKASYHWTADAKQVTDITSMQLRAGVTAVHEPFILEAGQTYVLRITACSPERFRHAQTAWAIYETEL